MIMASLFGLNDDVLRAVLVRSRGRDLANVCLTCHRFNTMVNSPMFRQERCEQGVAEVIVKIPSPFELYQSSYRDEDGPPSREDSFFQRNYDDFGFRDKTFGYQENKARIYIDGKLAGRSTFILLPRDDLRFNFHEMCDAVSQELQETGCAFFDRNARPRLQSVKDALTTNNKKKPFLYIKTFDLTKPEYRTISTTGAKALYKLLTDTKLKGMYSVAVYIPDARSQFTRQDRDWEHNYSNMVVARRNQGEPSQAEKAFSSHFDTLAKVDMRQFLQAGFQQATELVMDHNCYFLFAVPEFLEKPILTHEEAMAVTIVERPSERDKSDDEKKLLELMKQHCSERKHINESIQELMLPKEEHTFYKRMKSEMENNSVTMQGGIQTITTTLNTMQEYKHTLMTLLSNLDEESSHQMLSPLLASDAAAAERFAGKSTKDGIETLLSDVNQKIASAQQWFNDSTAILAKYQENEIKFDEIYQQSINEQLRSLRQNAHDFDATVRSEIAELVKCTGVEVIQSSNAIHAAACNLVPEYIELLMDFVPQDKKRDAINSLDSRGESPLRIAASSLNFPSLRPKIRLQTCKKIIELGGDKDLVDCNGLSAFGKFRLADRGARDFWGCHGNLHFGNPSYSAQTEFDIDMELLLEPSTGPTAADEDVVDAGSDESSGGWDEEEEEQGN